MACVPHLRPVLDGGPLVPVEDVEEPAPVRASVFAVEPHWRFVAPRGREQRPVQPREPRTAARPREVLSEELQERLVPADALSVAARVLGRAAIQDVIRQYAPLGHQPAEDDSEQVLECGLGRRRAVVGVGGLEPVSHIAVELLLQRLGVESVLDLPDGPPEVEHPVDVLRCAAFGPVADGMPCGRYRESAVAPDPRAHGGSAIVPVFGDGRAAGVGARAQGAPRLKLRQRVGDVVRPGVAAFKPDDPYPD